MSKKIIEAIRNMKELADQVQKLDREMPIIMGEVALKVTLENFRDESFDGKKWESRKEKTNKAYDRRGTYRGGVYNSSNPLLVQTGNLKDSIRYVIRGNMISIGVPLNVIPYAKAHNEGLGHQKKRQFVGYNNKMATRLRAKMESEYKRRFKQYFP